MVAERTLTQRYAQGLRRRLDLLVGLLVVVVVLSAGVLLWQSNPIEYRASATLVVLPAPAQATDPGYYDLLNQGQIVQTLAQVLDLGVAGDVQDEVSSISVTVVPDTFLIRVTATAPDPETAETAADSVMTRASTYFSELSAPYTASVISPATGTAERAGVPPRTLLVAVALVAAIAGIAALLATRALQRPASQVAAISTTGGAHHAPTSSPRSIRGLAADSLPSQSTP